MERDNTAESNDTKASVRDAYAKIAGSDGSCCGQSSCCGSLPSQPLGETLGYDTADLASLPDNADMGLSCGNPFALDSLNAGETVLDLGCGGGFDVFIAAKKVGRDGHVIGVDMTPAMIDRARKNIRAFTESTGLENTEIRLGEIEHLPVADSSVDVVISNCVINLSTEKPLVWREIARVLRPGGRISVSDLALLRPLPEAVRDSIEAYVGCVAGAVLIEETERMARDAGLNEVRITRHDNYITAMTEWSDPLYRSIMGHLEEGSTIADYVTSVIVTACKPE